MTVPVALDEVRLTLSRATAFVMSALGPLSLNPTGTVPPSLKIEEPLASMGAWKPAQP